MRLLNCRLMPSLTLKGELQSEIAEFSFGQQPCLGFIGRGRLLRGGWLGCTRAFVKWHLWRWHFALVHCQHTHTAIAPPATPRARSLASSRQAKAWLAWLGMVWYGLVREPGAFIMKWCYLPTQYLKIEFGTFCQIIAAPPSGEGRII